MAGNATESGRNLVLSFSQNYDDRSIQVISILLLNGVVSVIISSLEVELALDQPRVVVHVVHVEVLVCVVPADDVKEVVVVEHIVGERADLGQAWVTFHQVFLDVETEAFLGADCLVKAAKDQNGLTVDRHAHGQIASCPSRFCVQVDHSPHVVIDVVHLNGVRDLLFVELGAATENVDVLVVEDAAGSRVTSHIEVCDTAPSIILDVILLTSCVEALGIIATDDENQATLRVERREIRTLE